MGPEEGDYVVLIALTDPSAGTKGMSAIVVDRNTPGFSVGKLENKMGLRGANVSELIFQDCRVPKSNLLGKEGEAIPIRPPSRAAMAILKPSPSLPRRLLFGTRQSLMAMIILSTAQNVLSATWDRKRVIMLY